MRKPLKREFGHEHREAIVAEAERQLTDKGISYDRITFITGSNNTFGYDGLVYVWGSRGDGTAARTYGIMMPGAEEEEPGA